MNLSPYLWQHNPMITEGTSPSISINFGQDESGMTLQFRDVERGQIVWRNFTVDGETGK